MNHRQKFVKISPDHGVAGVGFGGNIFIVLSTLSFVGDDERLYIDMSKDCICNESDIYLHDTNNCWEYYFDQVTIEDNEIVNEMDSLVHGNLVYEDREIYMYPDNFLNLKNKFFNNFQIKPYLKKIIEDFYDENIKNKITLGYNLLKKNKHIIKPKTARQNIITVLKINLLFKYDIQLVINN